MVRLYVTKIIGCIFNYFVGKFIREYSRVLVKLPWACDLFNLD